MSVGILGRGFALYAYLPAFIELDFPVRTLSRYQSFIEDRKELCSYLKKISYVDSESDIINLSQTLVIARKPEQQFDLIKMSNLQNKRLFLEKPLASSTDEHLIMLHSLIEHNINFSVGYIFHLTDWFSQLSGELTCKQKSIKIEWELPVPAASWKSDLEQGGGLGASYAIHFVPILRLLGFKYKTGSRSNEVVFMGTGPNESLIEITVGYGKSNRFEIFSFSPGSKVRVLYSADSPVGKRSSAGKRDSRIDLLKLYIDQTFNQESSQYFQELEKSVIDFRIDLISDLH